MSRPIRILLVDDHRILLTALRLVLEREEDIRVVGEARSAEAALAAIARRRPDVVLLDLNMPGIGGLEGATAIKRRAPGVQVLVFSAHEDIEHLRAAFDAGADGYLPKSGSAVDLPPAVRAVAEGEKYVHHTLGAALAARPAPGPLAALTPRERQVFRLTALGHTSREIAEQLGLGLRTVENHRAQAMARLGVRTRAELMRVALAAGEIDTARRAVA